MDLIEQLEALRPTIGVYYAEDTDYARDLAAEEMLDSCLEIIWKWLRKKGLLDEVINKG